MGSVDKAEAEQITEDELRETGDHGHQKGWNLKE